MVFEAATPVTPAIPEDQPLGTQDEDKGNADNAAEASAKKPITEGINIDAFGIEWDQDLFRGISEATVPPAVVDKLKDAPFDALFDEAEKNLTNVKFHILRSFCILASYFLLIRSF